MEKRKHEEVLEMLEQVIKRSKQVVRLKFYDFQPITQFFKSPEGTCFDIDNSKCTIVENSEECIRWDAYSPPGATYPMHYHEVCEEVTMVKGTGTFFIERVPEHLEKVIVREGETFKVDRFVSHGFTNETNQVIEYKAVHYKN